MAPTTTEELRLIALSVDIGRAASTDEACALLVERLHALLGVPCALQSVEGEEPRVLAQSSTALRRLDVEAAMSVPLDGVHPATDILIPGDWAAAQDPAWLDALAAAAATGLQLVQFRVQRKEGDRRSETLREFSRALLQTSDSVTLHRTIVEHMARAVGAEIGALAVHLQQENSLAITATCGYPSVLVEHVRLAPGEGILGRVFVSGAPIVRSKLSADREQVTRRRYRTDSFIALPLAGPDGIVAVVSLTDKTTGEAFSAKDLSVLQEMAIPAALAVSREVMRDRTNDLAHLATVDALTGLFNRRYFETRLEQELQRQRRQLEDLSLLLLDLDNFKELNDTQGHLVGDVALKEVAEILRRAVRIFDVCARYGGEEFVILMPGAGASTALRIAERIRRQVEQHFTSGFRSGVPTPLTVSIGVSTANPSVTRDGLVAQADTALLAAKSTGKNRVNLHQDG